MDGSHPSTNNKIDGLPMAMQCPPSGNQPSLPCHHRQHDEGWVWSMDETFISWMTAIIHPTTIKEMAKVYVFFHQ
jgi:hypothetical protein